MKKNTIKKIASDVLNERFETKKRFGIISNTKKFQEKKFKTFTEGFSKDKLNSLKYLGNSQKLKELGLLKEGQMPGLFFINEKAEQEPICLTNITNAGGEDGSTGTAKICAYECTGGCGECSCIGEVKNMVFPADKGVATNPIGMNSMQEEKKDLLVLQKFVLLIVMVDVENVDVLERLNQYLLQLE